MEYGRLATDFPVVSALDVESSALWAWLSGLVPRIAVVAGQCFAGNAIIAGSSDLISAALAAAADRDGFTGSGRPPGRLACCPLPLQRSRHCGDHAIARD